MMKVFLGSKRKVELMLALDIITDGVASIDPGPALEPQSSAINLDSIAAFASLEGINLPDDVLSKIEGMTALFFALRECQTSSQFVSILVLYLKTLSSRSLIETAMKSLQDIFPNLLDPQTGAVLDGINEQPEWLKVFKKAQHNWQLIVMNEGFAKISKLLSLLVGLGLCEASQLECSFRGMRLFQFAAVPKHASAVDLLDAVASTIGYFVEGGYECIRTGSIDPLLYGDTNVQHFEEMYEVCEQGSTLARAGNLHLIDMDNSQLDFAFIAALAKVRELISVCHNPVLKRTLMDRQDRLRRMQTSFHETRSCGGLREAPFAMGFYGGSGVGKSSIANALMVILLTANGFDASDDKIVTLNESDKFMSNYKSYINGVHIDDIGNTKAEFVERAPTAKIIELINNVRAYANVAEADMKAKVSIEPKVVLTSKNVKDACAHVYSNEPASIARREKILITVRVKERFRTNDMLDASKVELYHDEAYPFNDYIPDLWELDLEYAYPIPSPIEGRPASVGWNLIEFEGKTMKNVGIKDLIRVATAMSKDHYRQQKEFVQKYTNVAKKMDFCEVCRLPSAICDGSCTCELESHAGPLVTLLTTKYFGYHFAISSFFAKKFESIENASLPLVINQLTWLEESRWTSWTNYIPQTWFDNGYVKMFIMAENHKNIRKSVVTRYWMLIILAVVLSCMCWTMSPFLIILFIPLLLAFTRVVWVEKEALYKRLRNDNRAMPEALRKYRDGYTQYITAACSVVAALYLLSKVWKSIKLTQLPQGNISPTSMQEIEERDLESTRDSTVAAEYNWSTAEISPIPATPKSKCSTPAELEKLCYDNLAFFTFEHNNELHGCDAFFVASNIAIVPQHMWKEGELLVTFRRHEGSKSADTFVAFLSKNQSIFIPNTDLSLVWVPNGGSWKDLTEYFPLERFQAVPAAFVHKDRNGSKVRDAFRITPGVVKSLAGTFPGWHYNMNVDTKFGFCMSPLVTHTKGTVIAGFHLAGKTGTPQGAAGILLQKQLKDAMLELSLRPGVLLCHSEGTMHTTTYDVQWFTGNTLHEKSPVHKLGSGTNFKVFGSTIGRSTYFSEVEDTVITDAVYDVTGVPNKHGKPKFRKGDPFAESLKYSSRPSAGIEPSLLEIAVDDYKYTLLRKLDAIPELKASIKPLTRMEIVAGKDGVRFIDKMPPNTSIGFPLGGAKRKHLTLLNPDDYPGHACPVELDPIFWAEFDRVEAVYLTGKRDYPVFKACLKDEPTLLTKDKVRVFQSAPLVLQMFTRKYFLPVARFLSLFPADSECAVGINPHGPEWDQFSSHIVKFGKNRILAGDYSKYDLRMPAQATMAAFRVLIDIAEACGYSQEDLVIMRGVATDVCYPCIAFNGDLLQFIGTNPSGQNLTVYINSIVNSLLFRSAFYSIYPTKQGFRKYCALGTYGDDAKSSVSQECEKFNHISVANFLAAHDMVFTMPDKESTPTKYMSDQDADFLKRKNVYNPDLDVTLGALDEASIFKSLHSTCKSKAVTPQQQCMSNIDGALREWFNHGRDLYEVRRLQMKEVAERCDLAYGCQMLDVSYEDYLVRWHDLYD